MTSALRQHVFRNHSAMFASLPPSSQSRYSSFADERAKAHERKHTDEAQHILARLTIARDRAGCEQRLRDKTNVVADHTIQPAEMEELLQLFNSKRCNREEVRTYLDNAVSPPAAAPQHVMDLFTGFVDGGRCSCEKMSLGWQNNCVRIGTFSVEPRSGAHWTKEQRSTYSCSHFRLHKRRGSFEQCGTRWRCDTLRVRVLLGTGIGLL